MNKFFSNKSVSDCMVNRLEWNLLLKSAVSGWGKLKTRAISDFGGVLYEFDFEIMVIGFKLKIDLHLKQL